MLFLFGLGNLFYVTVLLLNAIAILSEDRFLARVGWGRSQQNVDAGFGAQVDPSGFKARGVELISSVGTVVRIPLILLNTFIVFYELILG